MEKVRINISLFLISFSVFLYQVCLLRIFSISDYYHFAFMIVSIALLGFGISGSLLYFFIRKFKDKDLLHIFFSFSFSVSIFLSYVAINIIPFDSFRIAWETRQFFYLIIYYLFLVSPFFFAGSFIGYLFYDQEKPGVVYFYNLVGSAIGSISTIFLIPLISEKGVVFLSSAIGLVSSFVLMTRRSFRNFKVYLVLIIVFVAGVASVMVYFPSVMAIRMSPYKSLPTILRYPGSRILYSRENSYSKVDVVESSSIKSAPGLSLKYTGIPPEQLGLTIDGDNLSPITKVEREISNSLGANKESTGKENFSAPEDKSINWGQKVLVGKAIQARDKNSVDELEFLRYLPVSVPFEVKNAPENVLVLEPGGGLDVLTCVYNDSKNLYVVESNNLVIDVLSERFSEFSGGIYKKENVKIFETSSRNFARTTPVKFDLIVISLSDSFHPVSSGAYTLNENYIYTRESFVDLLSILKDDGILMVTRWVQFPPSEDLKVLSTLLESCRKLNIQDENARIFAFRSWSTVTLLFKKNGFTENEIQALKSKLKELNFDIVYYKGVREDEVNIYNKLEKNYFYSSYKRILDTSYGERRAFYENYYFNISPVKDDKPYFFNFFKFSQFKDIIKYFGKSTQPFGGAGYLMLLIAILISVVISFLFILFPLKFTRVDIKVKRDYGFLIYFFSIGLGFFFIELPFVQKFILILGKPAYSLSLVLFSLMLASGFGSYFSSRYNVNLKIVILLLVLYGICFIVCFQYLTNFLISRDMFQRFLYVVLLILPAGFLMGIPFPRGIARAKSRREEIVPWLWAVNGCASVVGSILAVIFSIHLGFLIVIGISLILYILAMIFFYKFC